ncbi:double-stranded RNA binding motif-containing protein [Moumouvirus goulette]|uniref:Double-stranded RNA binding motif-containing protein n=1 Tax=Moumouvirus goulette TaxID=1247379 RepID=M1PND5_9VIRU|nr:double-stranded RNA binding motif-containing protein [Moumouvirus goulette]AGF85506.1 double-stranded RNA binding motif-containing protein [Moumouvirus goulette]
MSAKNKLQEYFQRNKLPLPIYSSTSIGADHEKKWTSNIYAVIDDKEFTLIGDKYYNSKTESQLKVAEQMLDHINDQNKSLQNNQDKSLQNNQDKSFQKNNFGESNMTKFDLIKFDTTESNRTNIYLLDLENRPMHELKTNPNCIYIGFLNTIHHSVPKYNKWYRCQSDIITKELKDGQNNKLLFLIEGGVSDLVDHLMTLLIYPVVNYIKQLEIPPSIYIVSGDHAAWCTKTCLEKVLKWHDIKVESIINTITI